tara:strand:+ start:352 stop:1053 length:702 start_codon:yes stop_codon:yes gene_type:complete
MKRHRSVTLGIIPSLLFCIGTLDILPQAQAEDLYLTGNLGWPSALKQDFEIGIVDGEARSNPGGIAVSGAIGWTRDQLRVEAEFSVIETDFDQVNSKSANILGTTVNINLGTSLDGYTDTKNLMLNAWYDIKDPSIVGSDHRLFPFIGGGIGLSEVHMIINDIGGFFVNYDATDEVLAYQVGAGIGYVLGKKASLNFSYRYFAANGLEFDNGIFAIDTSFSSHLFLIGMLQEF